MLCPYPTTCEYDTYRRTGEHTCGHVKCPFIANTLEIVDSQIKKLATIVNRTEKQEAQLEKLKAQYARLLESR